MVDYLKGDPSRAEKFWANLERSNKVYEPYVKQWEQAGVRKDIIDRKTIVRDVEGLKGEVERWAPGQPVSAGLHEIATRLIRLKELEDEKVKWEEGVKGKITHVWLDMDSGIWPSPLGNAPQAMIEADTQRLQQELLQFSRLHQEAIVHDGNQIMVFSPDPLDNHPHHRDSTAIMNGTLKPWMGATNNSVKRVSFLAAWAGDYDVNVHYGEDVERKVYGQNSLTSIKPKRHLAREEHEARRFKGAIGILDGELTASSGFGGQSPKPQQMGGYYAERFASHRFVPNYLPGVSDKTKHLPNFVQASRAIEEGLSFTESDLKAYQGYIQTEAQKAFSGQSSDFHFIKDTEGLPQLATIQNQKGLFWDIGGTRIKYGVGKLVGNTVEFDEENSDEVTLTDDQVRNHSGSAKIKFIVQKLAEFLKLKRINAADLPTGLIFSFANDNGLVLQDAHRSKDFDWLDIVGQRIQDITKRELQEALNVKILEPVVINDTKAVAVFGQGGLVNGTGMNLYVHGHNTEIGNRVIPKKYLPPIYRRLELGRDVRIEDVAAGKYLGHIAQVQINALITAGLLFKPNDALPPRTITSPQVDQYEREGGPDVQGLVESWGIPKDHISSDDLQIVKRVFAQVLLSSQELLAVVIKGLISATPLSGKVRIAADGSVFKKTGYLGGLNTALQRRRGGPEVEVTYVPDATQKGAVAIAIAQVKKNANPALTAQPSPEGGIDLGGDYAMQVMGQSPMGFPVVDRIQLLKMRQSIQRIQVTITPAQIVAMGDLI